MYRSDINNCRFKVDKEVNNGAGYVLVFFGIIFLIAVTIYGAKLGTKSYNNVHPSVECGVDDGAVRRDIEEFDIEEEGMIKSLEDVK